MQQPGILLQLLLYMLFEKQKAPSIRRGCKGTKISENKAF